MNKLNMLSETGQSIWLDYIRRSFIEKGELQSLIDQGVRGITSNPTIFDKAIAGSDDYDDDLRELVLQGKSEVEIYEILTMDDIRKAADLLLKVYEETGGHDGYISLEVSPDLAYDTEGTVKEAIRLFRSLKRPNVMIKVPSTPQGIPAIERLTREGVNVNVTLIFSLNHYKKVFDAYMSGLEKRIEDGKPIDTIASVASVFVSRVDTAVDKELESCGNKELQGNIAVTNAKIIYRYFRDTLSGERWQQIARKGANLQRVLWGSTGTKNPLYSDTLYIDYLIGPDTVNTVPPATLNAFLDHGTVASTLESGLDEAQKQVDALSSLEIDLDEITEQLQKDGVAAFKNSYDSLIASITSKHDSIRTGLKGMNENLGSYRKAVNIALSAIVDKQIIERIWKHDHTVWKPVPEEINNRLGWLHIVENMQEQVPELNSFADEVREDGYTTAVLLGMGGSSLAPEMFSKIFGTREGYLSLHVLDSTDPGAVSAITDDIDIVKTLFIVSTKSGGTIETLSFFKHMYNKTVEAVGGKEAGSHFIAITDPGSSLVGLAEQYNFRRTFLNDPNIGGRYSALSYFGLVPASLLGMDLEKLLNCAYRAVCNSDLSNCPMKGDNLGGRLGTIIGELANQGRDKITILLSKSITSFGDWVEQLLAESTGKEGKGILPIVNETPGLMDVYGKDRQFVFMKLEDDNSYDQVSKVLADSDHPVITFTLNNIYDVGEQLFIWEMATAVAGHILDINPFDQPNVESAKLRAKEMIRAYDEKGSLPKDQPEALDPDALHTFLSQAGSGCYISLQAYINPTDDSDKALAELRTKLRNKYRLAVTSGYGPRFLHSTGQLHKGDAGNGIFVQFTADPDNDIPIPDNAGSESSVISFGTLILAQALGDKQALLDNGRSVIRFHLSNTAYKGIRNLMGD